MTDPEYETARVMLRIEGRVSPQILQRRLRIGYGRAVGLIEELREKGCGVPEENREYALVYAEGK